jgi:phosphate transport system substrate-binding protein
LKRTRLLGLVMAVTVAASLSTGLTAAASAASLTGAGSTLMTPLMAKWNTDYQTLTGNMVNYGSVGSGAGITQITNRTVDFGASDAPLTAAQAAQCNGCKEIPWALTATAIAINIPGIRKVNLSPLVLAAIYLGQVKNWNDPQIAKLNKGTTLPNLAITPVYRSDGSGDTYAFTDLLSHASSTWKSRVGVATSVSFPVGKGGAKNDGVTALVSSTPGALAYIAASYVIAHNLNAAALQNRAGKFAYPNLKAIAAAATAFPKVPANEEMHIVYPPKSAKSAYPLATYSYAIVPNAPKQAALLQNFLSYAIGRGLTAGEQLDFSPLPKAVVKADRKAIASL